MAGRAIIALSAALLLAACGSKNAVTPSSNADEANASGQDGKLAIDAPGFQMKVSIPDVAQTISASGHSDLLYPGSSVRGVNIQAKGPGKDEKASVAVSFFSPVATDKLVAWYRAPDRRGDFQISSVSHTTTGNIELGGSKTDGDGTFTVKFNPAPGGSAGELTIAGD